MFNFFKKKKRGCLYGKTQQEKIDFFRSLSEFAIKDNIFFEQQYWDLLDDERREFGEWVIQDTKLKRQMLEMVKLIGNLLEEKHRKK